MSDEPQTGQEAIDEIGALPSLDPFFDRNPSLLTDAEWLMIIETERKRRAMFIEKKASK